MSVKPTSTAVISLATDARRYPEALARLEQSVKRVGFEGQRLSWPPGSFPDGCPSHQDVPFAFKPYCFREARDRGVELGLWLDAACVVIRDLTPIFNAIRDHGYVLFRNHGQMVGQWASDEALRLFDLDRDEAMQIPEVDASVIGLHFHHPVGREFLERWHASAADGAAFRGIRERLREPQDYADVKWNRGGRVSSDPRVRGHRHDQTVAGILAHRLQMTLTRAGLQKYSIRRRRIRHQTVIVVDRDVGRIGSPLQSVDRIRLDKYVGGIAQLLRGLRRGEA